MSTKSKTGAKLVASIRKSKTGAVAKKTSERPAVSKSTATKKKASTTKSKPAAPKSSSKLSTNTANETVFSHGRRVWPD